MAESGIYLYGIAAEAEAPALPEGVHGVDERHRVGLVVEGDLVAIVSPVDIPALQEQLRGAEDGDLALLEPLVRAHEEVLARALEVDAVVPFRFGTIFRGEPELRAFVSERAPELEQTLRRLSGALEWGVKGLLDPERAEAAAAADDPQLAELVARAGEGSGASFFARKRLEVDQAERLRRVGAELAAECHERLAACAREATVNQPQPPGLSGYAAPMILNGSYLVERGREDELRAVLEQLRAECADRGLALELTGPWPAYNFVGPSPAVVA